MVAKTLVEAGYKVYLAQTPAQANERLREGKTEILIFSPDFASELGGTAIFQQKINFNAGGGTTAFISRFG